MTRRRRWIVGGTVLALLLLSPLLSSRVQFIVGGALINVGFRFQDHHDAFDFEHHEDIGPEQVWEELVAHNELSSAVRRQFPRTARHPLVAMLVCMDARIDTSELAGDTRSFYYVLRTAGSVLSEKEDEMLELAVSNGVKVILLTTHTDCAAEKAAADPAMRLRFPHLTVAVGERSARVKELLARPLIAEKINAGQLLVKWVDIDTMNEHISPHVEPSDGHH